MLVKLRIPHQPSTILVTSPVVFNIQRRLDGATLWPFRESLEFPNTLESSVCNAQFCKVWLSDNAYNTLINARTRCCIWDLHIWNLDLSSATWLHPKINLGFINHQTLFILNLIICFADEWTKDNVDYFRTDPIKVIWKYFKHIQPPGK